MEPLVIPGGVVMALFVIAAMIAPWWTPWPIDGVDIAGRFAAATASHPLGTDQYGRDLVSMLMAGASISLGVAAAAVVIGVGLGTPLGLFAASVRGWPGALVLRAGDVVFAFPALIVAAMLTTAFGPSAANPIIAIGVFNVPVFARITAAGARHVLAQDYIDAARLAGKGRARIATEHVLPNVAPVILTQAVTQFAVAVLAEAGLSYVGLGVQPPSVSWGRMLAEAQTLVAIAPQLSVWPGFAIFAVVLGATAVGDALRSRLDPRLVVPT